MINSSRKLKRLDNEEWRVIPGTDGVYYASNYGRIKSFYYDKVDGRIMRSATIKNYLMTRIRINGKYQNVLYHKVIAEAWIPRPSKEHTIVTHLDRNVKNNHISNLCWQTREENNKINGEYFKKLFTGRKHPTGIAHAKLSASDVAILKALLQNGITQAKIAKMFCISEMQVTRIKRGENWSHIEPLASKTKRKKSSSSRN